MAEHPEDIPESAGLVLSGDGGGDGDAEVKGCAGDEYGEGDSGFCCGLGDFDLLAVKERLGSGVGEDDGAE
jgi:hypothetical protein